MPRHPSIKILTFLTPQSNPRVAKESQVFLDNGYTVEIVTSAFPGPQPIPVQTGKGCAVRKLNHGTPLGALWRNRFFKKVAGLWPGGLRHQIRGYGTLFIDLYQYLKTLQEDAFPILHLEPALLAGEATGILPRSAVDFEDWYSEDVKPIDGSSQVAEALRRAEGAALQRAAACWCPSQAMAQALAGRYGGEEPLVIRNTFPRQNREQLDGRWVDRPGMASWADGNHPTAERPKNAPISFHWFSQTIGPGRGLESVLQALAGVEGNWEFHLRGGIGNYKTWLERFSPEAIKPRLHVHPLVGPQELPSRIAEHDIGLACEQNTPLPRDVTISNKLFQYLQGGLAVVASDTSGQREAACYAAGALLLYPAGDVAQLQALLQNLVKDRRHLRGMRRAAWQAGEKLCWENESPRLVETVQAAMEKLRQTKPRKA